MDVTKKLNEAQSEGKINYFWDAATLYIILKKYYYVFYTRNKGKIQGLLFIFFIRTGKAKCH